MLPCNKGGGGSERFFREGAWQKGGEVSILGWGVGLIPRRTLCRLSFAMRCAIWYHLHNLKNVKDTHGGATLLKVTLLGFFSRFLNCTNDIKSRKTLHLVSVNLNHHIIFLLVFPVSCQLLLCLLCIVVWKFSSFTLSYKISPYRWCRWISSYIAM